MITRLLSSSTPIARPSSRTLRERKARKRVGVTLSAAFVALVAVLVLVGWWFGLEPIKRILPGMVAMNPVVAVAFILGAISLWGANGGRAADARIRRISSACAAVVAAIGAVKLLGVVWGFEIGIDRLLFTSKLDETISPNRMAPNTAFNLLLIGAGLLLLHSRKRRVSVWAWALALLCGFLSLVVVLGYTYSIDSLYGVTSFIPMALHTAICFLVLTYGILTCQAGRGFLAVLTGDNAAGSMARRVLPAVILIPIGVGWLHLHAERADLLSAETAVAVHSVTIMVLFAWLISWNALLLFRSDKARASAERRVRRQHAVLEHRVAERTAQLSIVNSELEKSRHHLEEHVQERTRALETALKVNHQIMENSLDVICIIDREGRFTTVSAACEKLWGYTPAELVGRRFIEFVHPDDHERTNKTASGIISGHVVRDFENRYLRKDGSTVFITWSVYWSEEEQCMFCVARDATERKRSEEALRQATANAERANRAKSEFLANMSHEIRTPMNGILGMTELTLETELNREQREYLGMVKTSAHSLLGVINDILDFSKIEAGKLEMELLSFSLRGAVGAMLKPLGLRADEKQIELLADIPADVPDHLIGDPMRLRQILLNLTDNAIKFTEQGEVIVKATTESTADGQTELHFSVADTGIGIPKEKQAAIFEAFSQVDGSTTRHYGGTGLGLAIATRLVQQMRGRIWVESRLGFGTTFHFTIWLGTSAAPVPAVKQMNPASLEGLRVLIVDDNAINCRILEEMLANWLAKPVAVRSAQAALETMRTAAGAGDPFPLVLVDAMMPEMDGFALAKSIKQEPRLANATLMMLSSAMRSGQTSRASEAGIHSVLTKPVMQSELLDGILLALSSNEFDAFNQASDDGAPSGSNEGQLSVLVAEDNAINRAVISGLLGKLGHTLTHAANGLEAVAAVTTQRFDLIMMDVQMPEMDGFEATARIRELDKQTGRNSRIVAMTAHAMTGDRERCLAAGMDDYLSKPLQRAELLAVLDQAVIARSANNLPVTLASGPSATSPTSSRAKLLAELGDDEELLQELIELFRESTPRLLEDLRGSIARQDGGDLARSAHALLGSFGVFGAIEAHGFARQLEDLGRDGDTVAAPETFRHLESETARVAEALEKMTRLAA